MRAHEVVHWSSKHPEMTPGRRVYALSAGLLVAAVVVATIIVVGLVRSAEDIQRMVAPGEATMELDATGTHEVFYERDTVFQGQSFSGPAALPALDLVLVNEDTGEQVTGPRRSDPADRVLLRETEQPQEADEPAPMVAPTRVAPTRAAGPPPPGQPPAYAGRP